MENQARPALIIKPIVKEGGGGVFSGSLQDFTFSNRFLVFVISQNRIFLIVVWN
jgi:hypothetical protein